MSGGFCGQPGGEILVAVVVAPELGPRDHVPTIGLEMALESPHDAVDAKRLIPAGLALEQPDGAGRDVERVVVPLHGTAGAFDFAEQRVVGRGGCRHQRRHAEFRGSTDPHLGSPGAREQLAAKADAENGPACGRVAPCKLE